MTTGATSWRPNSTARFCIKASVPHLTEHGRGVIINIGASSAHAGTANGSADATAKMGLAGLTGSLAVKLAPLGITVNYVAPGRIARPGGASPHFQARPIPAGREGTSEEFAATVRTAQRTKRRRPRPATLTEPFRFRRVFVRAAPPGPVLG
jgi:NAD(P)-dependent dehydrogenase (short-subunit alcohol dehydrogenase family)